MTVENVVYFLGAGFSAPLGLPTISDFILRAKDQHILDQRGNPSFEAVFKAIDRLARVGMAYSAQLDNIEEVLSILEVDAFLGEPSLREVFQDFIRGVIRYRTPQMLFSLEALRDNWQQNLFGITDKTKGYGYFVAAIQLLRFARPVEVVECNRAEQSEKRYDVITANYDCVLENVCEYVSEHLAPSLPVRFREFPTEDASLPTLAKLHGSVANGDIVPPTWSKGAHPDIAPRWRLARETLRRAQHLRFIGYSLPEADSYVRYLLKSAALETPHLKTIDVMCQDPTGEVQKRYEEFVTFPRFRFANKDFGVFLSQLGIATDPPTPPWRMVEQAHWNAFF
jgi:hypothetical protein